MSFQNLSGMMFDVETLGVERVASSCPSVLFDSTLIQKRLVMNSMSPSTLLIPKPMASIRTLKHWNGGKVSAPKL